MNKSVKSKENYKLKQIILPRCYMQKSIDIAGCLLYNENVKIYNFTQKGACIIVLYDEDFLSGEQQKIAIARALCKDAPVVILDEPTAALDPIAEYEIYKQFNSLVGGKSAFYISHRLSSCQFCDRIAVFSDGHIAEYGTHAELEKIEGGIYAEMFEAQAKYYKD